MLHISNRFLILRPLHRPLCAAAIIACTGLLGACSNLEFPWVYRIDIDQGNIITADKVAELKPGMTRDQVKFVMGSPLLVDSFHPDRWDYIYTLRKPNGTRTRQQLTVNFKDDVLVSISGDAVAAPTEAAPTTKTN